MSLYKRVSLYEFIQNGEFASCCIRTNESPPFDCTSTHTCARTEAQVHAPAGGSVMLERTRTCGDSPPLALDTTLPVSLTLFPTLCRVRALQNGEQSTKSLPLLRRSERCRKTRGRWRGTAQYARRTVWCRLSSPRCSWMAATTSNVPLRSCSLDLLLPVAVCLCVSVSLCVSL